MNITAKSNKYDKKNAVLNMLFIGESFSLNKEPKDQGRFAYDGNGGNNCHCNVAPQLQLPHSGFLKGLRLNDPFPTFLVAFKFPIPGLPNDEGTSQNLYNAKKDIVQANFTRCQTPSLDDKQKYSKDNIQYAIDFVPQNP